MMPLAMVCPGEDVQLIAIRGGQRMRKAARRSGSQCRYDGPRDAAQSPRPPFSKDQQ